MLQLAHQKPWTLSLRAKLRNLDFKLKVTRIILPVSKFFSFSIHFKLHPYLLQIKSKPEPSFCWKPKSPKLKFFQIYKNFRRKRPKNKGIVRSWLAHENYCCKRRKTCICLWVLLFAMLGCFTIMKLSNYFSGGFMWKFFWNTWSYAAPTGLSYKFAKVIFDGIFRYER